MTNKQLMTALGVSLMLCGFSLCGMFFGSIGTTCEYSGWGGTLLFIGSYCAVEKGWGYFADGLDLNVKPDNRRGPPL